VEQNLNKGYKYHAYHKSQKYQRGRKQFLALLALKTFWIKKKNKQKSQVSSSINNTMLNKSKTTKYNFAQATKLSLSLTKAYA